MASSIGGRAAIGFGIGRQFNMTWFHNVTTRAAAGDVGKGRGYNLGQTLPLGALYTSESHSYPAPIVPIGGSKEAQLVNLDWFQLP